MTHISFHIIVYFKSFQLFQSFILSTKKSLYTEIKNVTLLNVIISFFFIIIKECSYKPHLSILIAAVFLYFSKYIH